MGSEWSGVQAHNIVCIGASVGVIAVVGVVASVAAPCPTSLLCRDVYLAFRGGA